MQKTSEVINVLIFMLLQNLSIICSLQLQKSDLRTRNCKKMKVTYLLNDYNSFTNWQTKKLQLDHW